MARGKGGDYDVNSYGIGDMNRDMDELKAATTPDVKPEVLDTQWIGGHGSDKKDKAAAEAIARRLAPAAAKKGLVIGVTKAGRGGGYNVTVERPAKKRGR